MRKIVDGVPVCGRGHPVTGWNAKAVKGYKGRTYLLCRECQNLVVAEHHRLRRAAAKRARDVFENAVIMYPDKPYRQALGIGSPSEPLPYPTSG